MSRPQTGDFHSYYERYIDRVKADDPASAIKLHGSGLESFYIHLPESKADYAYASGKWTLKDVLQHIIDTERIMSYRLLRIARNDQTPLPSFDENSFAETARAGERSFDDLKREFEAVRAATDLLIHSLHPEQLALAGTASNGRTTANAIAFIIFGHLLHHREIIEERYL